MQSIVSTFLALLQAVFTLILDREAPGGGAAKRAAVITDVELLLPSIPGASWLGFVPKPLMDWIIGLAIDKLVAAANRGSFFVSGSAGGPAS